MKVDLQTFLLQKNIKFPNFWDPKLALDLFISCDQEDIPEELHTTPTIWKKWSKEIFLDKPEKGSYIKYLRPILEEYKTLDEKFTAKKFSEILNSDPTVPTREVYENPIIECVTESVSEYVPEPPLPEGRSYSDEQIENSFSLPRQKQVTFVKNCTPADYKAWKIVRDLALDKATDPVV